MVMDPGFKELSAIMNAEINFEDYYLDNGFRLEELFSHENVMGLPFAPPDPSPSFDNDLPPCLGVNPDGNSPEDGDIFSDIALNYISQMLLEEDHDVQGSFNEESLALQATENSFYEVLGEKYPPSPDQHPLHVDHDAESPEEYVGDGGYSNCTSGSSSSSSNADGSTVCEVGEYSSPQNVITAPRKCSCQSPSFNSSNCSSSVVNGLEDSPTNKVGVSDFHSTSLPARQFQKGKEEASKFLPNRNALTLNLENARFLPLEPKEESHEVVEVKVEKKDERDHQGNGSRGRKNPHPDDLELEGGRSNKQTAVFQEGTVRSEMFDRVLLCGEGQCGSELAEFREALQNGVSKNSQNEQAKGSHGGGKSRGKRQGKREVVDLRTLLIQCAQAVAANDRRTGSELLKQIRQHSHAFGDGQQRLAHYLANALEARLAGTGSEIYMQLARKQTTAVEFLKAYHLYLAACPFKKISYFFANQTILDTVENAPRLHIVDFGIGYGFQWPCFLQRLGGRPSGPPKLRITGIDRPQPGFRPADRVEETGRRLADYAQTFNVPFEYVPIACSNWETIQVEDLNIESDEVLVVNCCFQFNKLADETVAIDSPRDIVFKTIRKLNPNVFIHGAINGAYSAPFFVTRFREALFHWSALYDMLETNVPREQPERMLIEREFFGREAMNVIACEGAERVERPETYKQWRVRMMRAGLVQLPLNQDIMKKARDKVRSSYHKDFVIDQDGQWMLQGWKGRIIYALSTWRSDEGSF